MKTTKTVATSRAGTVEAACDDPKGWEFGVSASVEDGRDVVAVRLSRADDAPPPAFEVRENRRVKRTRWQLKITVVFDGQYGRMAA